MGLVGDPTNLRPLCHHARVSFCAATPTCSCASLKTADTFVMAAATGPASEESVTDMAHRWTARLGDNMGR